VVIASGDLTSSAFDNVLRAYLEAAVHRGVEVTLLSGSQTREPAEKERVTSLAGELQTALVARGSFRVNLEPKPVHAKLLIVDGRTSVITSFSFLSYRGYRFGAHELGLKVYSSAIAAALTAEVESAIRT